MGYTSGELGLYFNFMSSLPPAPTLTSTTMNLWIRKAVVISSELRSWPSSYSLLLKTGFCDLFVFKSLCFVFF